MHNTAILYLSKAICHKWWQCHILWWGPRWERVYSSHDKCWRMSHYYWRLAATCTDEWPMLSTWFGSAPPSSRACTSSRDPASTALWSAVCCPLSGWLTRAPDANSARMISGWPPAAPLAATRCSGVWLLERQTTATHHCINIVFTPIGVGAGGDRGIDPPTYKSGGIIPPACQTELHAKLFGNVRLFYACPMFLCMAAGKWLTAR